MRHEMLQNIFCSHIWVSNQIHPETNEFIHSINNFRSSGELRLQLDGTNMLETTCKGLSDRGKKIVETNVAEHFVEWIHTTTMIS